MTDQAVRDETAIHDETAVRDETKAVLRAHAEKAEQSDRLSAASLDALRDAGVFALRTPAAYGGKWASTEAVARCLADLGRACPSSAWIAGTCLTAKNITARSFPGPEVAEVFADPDTLAGGSGLPMATAERVPGGIRVSGHWPNVSGCEDATWVGLAMNVDGVMSYALVPVADLAIERTWNMAGMRGTGSHTVVADDLLIPDRRVAPWAPFALGDLLLYRTAVLAPVVGAARGALDAIDAMFASDRKPFGTAYSKMGDSPGARQWLAEATHLVNRAEATMLDAARRAEVAESSAADFPRLRMDLAGAGRDCRAAVELMLDLHGASGFNTANVLQRFWRDVAVASRHPQLNPYLASEDFGTTLVGPS